jgi:hypothetical protein
MKFCQVAFYERPSVSHVLHCPAGPRAGQRTVFLVPTQVGMLQWSLDLTLRGRTEVFWGAEQSNQFGVRLSQNLKVFGWITTLFGSVDQSVTVTKWGTNDHGTQAVQYMLFLYSKFCLCGVHDVHSTCTPCTLDLSVGRCSWAGTISCLFKWGRGRGDATLIGTLIGVSLIAWMKCQIREYCWIRALAAPPAHRHI